MLDSRLRCRLLDVARDAVEAAASGKTPAPPVRVDSEETVWEDGACFVTLSLRGGLRGCIGSLEARQPLIMDVQEHATDAALRDFRFAPVRPEEAGLLKIEISVLTKPVPISVATPGELPGLLRPRIDGVILSKGNRKATFLPQVWEQLPDPEVFLSHLCEKMGVRADQWRTEPFNVHVYQVECFEEERR